jgi:hypothetical protein
VNEIRIIRDFLESVKKPVSIKEIEKATGINYRSSPIPQLLRNNVLREWWGLNPGRSGKPFEEYNLSDYVKSTLRWIALTKEPKRIEQIASESEHHVNVKDAHYALVNLFDSGEVMVYYDLEPKSNCDICHNREYCREQKSKGDKKALDATRCNNFISEWK